MRPIPAEQLRSAVGGRWLRRPATLPVSRGVGIDSRHDLAGRAFFAIRGERYDGHAFLAAASRAGASLLVVETDRCEGAPPGAGVIGVDDTRKALGRLAHDERRSWRDTRVVAITGTAGKTTTKRLVHAVLGTSFPGTAAPRSFNNDIGVPLTLLSARPDDHYVVVEVGTNAPGEIDALGRLAEPDVAVITLVGCGHLEGLGSVVGVMAEKTSLLRHLRPGGVAVLHADSVLAPPPRPDRETITFGRADAADVRIVDSGRDSEGWWFQVAGGGRFTLRLPGAHNALNALAALVVARRLGIDDDDTRRALAEVEPDEMRLRPVRFDGLTVYNDAYNANPESMKASLETFIELSRDDGHRTVVLGDMLELGSHGPRLHRALGEFLIELDRWCRLDRVVLVGPLMRHAATVLDVAWGDGRVIALPELDDRTAAQIRARFPHDGTVLLKGSRGLRLERILKSKTDVLQPAPGD